MSASTIPLPPVIYLFPLAPASKNLAHGFGVLEAFRCACFIADPWLVGLECGPFSKASVLPRLRRNDNIHSSSRPCGVHRAGNTKAQTRTDMQVGGMERVSCSWGLECCLRAGLNKSFVVERTFALFYSALLCSALLCSALLCSALLYGIDGVGVV
jgi:hypothetical protein